MKSSIELQFCDYCTKSIDTISVMKCGICEKDICEKCVDTSLKQYCWYGEKPNCCKHCIGIVENMIYQNKIAFKRRTDYRMSWCWSSIDIGSEYRYFYDLFSDMAHKKANEQFYKTMKWAINKKKVADKISEKKRELEREFNEKLSMITNV